MSKKRRNRLKHGARRQNRTPAGKPANAQTRRSPISPAWIGERSASWLDRYPRYTAFGHLAFATLTGFTIGLIASWLVAELQTGLLLAIAVLVLGMGTPVLIERLSHSFASHTDTLALLAGLSGLSLHAFLEGAAFSSEVARAGIAVILHRIPVGLMIWWLLRPRYGFVGASLGIGAIVAATIAGYLLGARLFGDSQGGGAELYQAFVGGSLLHTVFHQGRHTHRHHAHD